VQNKALARLKIFLMNISIIKFLHFWKLKKKYC